MIIIRAYRALSEMVVEVSATEPWGDWPPSLPLKSVFVGRAYFDGSSCLGPEELSEAVHAICQREAEWLGGSHGGLTGLL